MKTITAAKAKAEFLALLEAVANSGQAIVVTKRGKPVARIAPLEAKRGSLKSRMKITGDVVAPVPETWAAL